MKRKVPCFRCESVGREPQEGIHDYVGFNGIKGKLCNQCDEEVKQEDNYFVMIDNSTEIENT